MFPRAIAHYQIVEKIGEGGMGVVYKARDTRLERMAALKVLPADKTLDPERKRRFVQEAKAASALNHPNIVTIYDIGTDDGIDFIAMEYLAGRPLEALIQRQGMRPAEVLRITVQITDALATAHAAGIIHRDLKPGNIMVSETGLVKVLDFGLAKLTEKSGIDQESPTETLGAQTGEGTILGTIAYLSPEQAQGLKLDPRSDIFSFGAVLYEMITGQRFPRRNQGFDYRRNSEPRAGAACGDNATRARPHRASLPAQRASAALPDHGGPKGRTRGIEGRIGFRSTYHAGGQGGAKTPMVPARGDSSYCGGGCRRCVVDMGRAAHSGHWQPRPETAHLRRRHHRLSSSLAGRQTGGVSVRPRRPG